MITKCVKRYICSAHIFDDGNVYIYFMNATHGNIKILYKADYVNQKVKWFPSVLFEFEWNWGTHDGGKRLPSN